MRPFHLPGLTSFPFASRLCPSRLSRLPCPSRFSRPSRPSTFLPQTYADNCTDIRGCSFLTGREIERPHPVNPQALFKRRGHHAAKQPGVNAIARSIAMASTNTSLHPLLSLAYPLLSALKASFAPFASALTSRPARLAFPARPAFPAFLARERANVHAALFYLQSWNVSYEQSPWPLRTHICHFHGPSTNEIYC